MTKTSYDPDLMSAIEYELYERLLDRDPSTAYQIRMDRKLEHILSVYKTDEALRLYATETLDEESLDAFAFWPPHCHLILLNQRVTTDQLNVALATLIECVDSIGDGPFIPAYNDSISIEEHTALVLEQKEKDKHTIAAIRSHPLLNSDECADAYDVSDNNTTPIQLEFSFDDEES